MARAGAGDTGTAWGRDMGRGLTLETRSPSGSLQETWVSSETLEDAHPGHCGACPPDETPSQP